MCRTAAVMLEERFPNIYRFYLNQIFINQQRIFTGNHETLETSLITSNCSSSDMFMIFMASSTSSQSFLSSVPSTLGWNYYLDDR